MTPAEYERAAEGLEAVLQLFRRNEADLRVSEIRIRANLEAARAELLKMALTGRDEPRRLPVTAAGVS